MKYEQIVSRFAGISTFREQVAVTAARRLTTKAQYAVGLASKFWLPIVLEQIAREVPRG